FEFDEASVASVVATAIAGSLRILDEYPAVLRGDPMITFDLPPDIGIGIARGSATCLVAGDRIIDYTGRPLNLGSRLMSLARPRGLVFDARLLHGVPLDGIEPFEQEQVYVRGIADDEPIPVLYRSSWTKIPDAAKRPPAPQ